MLTFDTLPDKVKENYRRNITTSVAFVKKDGTVRHIAFRRSIKAYEASSAEKTDAQMNVLKNNNLMNVVDTNAYIRGLKEFGGDSAAASKKAFRNFKLENVLAFMASGQVFDMREENGILEKFGEEVYSQLTKSMVNALSNDERESANIDDLIPTEPENPENMSEMEFTMEEEIDWDDELDAYKPKGEPSDDDIDAMADQEDEKHAVKNYDDFESGAIYESLNRMKKLISY
jgi:hypothetical protein